MSRSCEKFGLSALGSSPREVGIFNPLQNFDRSTKQHRAPPYHGSSGAGKAARLVIGDHVCPANLNFGRSACMSRVARKLPVDGRASPSRPQTARRADRVAAGRSGFVRAPPPAAGVRGYVVFLRLAARDPRLRSIVPPSTMACAIARTRSLSLSIFWTGKSRFEGTTVRAPAISRSTATVILGSSSSMSLIGPSLRLEHGASSKHAVDAILPVVAAPVRTNPAGYDSLRLASRHLPAHPSSSASSGSSAQPASWRVKKVSIV